MTLLLLAQSLARAQGEKQDDTQQRLKALEERILTLEAEIRSMKAERATPPSAETAAQAAPPAQVSEAPTPAPAPAPVTAAAAPPATVEAPAGLVGSAATPLPVYGGASAAAKVMNPDISVIGDFVSGAGHNPVHGVPSFQMHESEVGLQSIIDPYARGDFFITFGEQGVNLEEGYITFTSLPGGFVAKVGKMRSAFGIVNTLHNHVMPWADRPLVTENLVGGEDGVNDAGFSVTRILPAPKDVFLEATAQVFRGDSEGVFKATNNSDVAFVGHLRGYHDLSESSNVDMGLSYGRGHNDVGSAFRTQLFGVDATYRWKPLRRAIYHNFLLRSELVWSRRDQIASIQRAFGYYVAADYRLTRRWTLGGRYDRSGRATDATQIESGFSPVITYWPSEFSQLRGQYRFTTYPDGRQGNDLLFQLLFVLGAHGAHPF
jgi:hypothetical protein